MTYTYKSPGTDSEWRDYFELRWQTLRAPWQQPRGSERDPLESDAHHVMAIAANQEVVGAGRVHRLDENSAQVRYMAVAALHQGHGIGAHILSMLEAQAWNWGCREIILNARETCLGFYLKHGYEILSDGPSLFGSIAHKHMRKRLDGTTQTGSD